MLPFYGFDDKNDTFDLLDTDVSIEVYKCWILIAKKSKTNLLLFARNCNPLAYLEVYCIANF